MMRDLDYLKELHDIIWQKLTRIDKSASKSCKNKSFLCSHSVFSQTYVSNSFMYSYICLTIAQHQMLPSGVFLFRKFLFSLYLIWMDYTVCQHTKHLHTSYGNPPFVLLLLSLSLSTSVWCMICDNIPLSHLISWHSCLNSCHWKTLANIYFLAFMCSVPSKQKVWMDKTRKCTKKNLYVNYLWLCVSDGSRLFVHRNVL